MKNVKDNQPSVLAFEKKLVPSDGVMYATNWQDRSTDAPLTALKIQEKSVRGTISNRKKNMDGNNVAKLEQDIQKPNLQTVDVCALPFDRDTLKLNFTLKILGGIENPSACNSLEYRSL